MRVRQGHWDVLEDIASRTELPLVLHDPSGISAADLAKATSVRVGKVNFNTEPNAGHAQPVGEGSEPGQHGEARIST